MIQKTFGLPGTLPELMESMTHREYLTRLAWIEAEWKIPNRSDWYAMQVAQEVRRVLSKKPNAIKLKEFKLKFEDTEKKKESPKETMDHSKSVWYAIAGLPIPQQEDYHLGDDDVGTEDLE